MNDFMYNKVMQLIEDKLQLELEIIRLKSEIVNQKLDYETKINNLELDAVKYKYELITKK